MLKELKTYFFNKSIGIKLIIYFLGIILLLTITITAWGNMSYRKSINSSQNENTNQIITQINNNIDFYVKDTEKMINYLSKDPRILEFLEDNKLDNDDLEDCAYDALYNCTSLNQEIAGIMIVNRIGGYISDVMNKVSRDSLLNEKWYKNSCGDPEKTYIQIKPVGRNINNIFKYPADEVFSMSKAIVDNKSKEIVGVILVDVKLDVIRNVIENAKPGTAGFIYIMDDEDNVVYTPVNKIVYRIDNEWLKDIDNNIIIKKIEGENYQLTKVVSDYSGWQTIGVFPEKESLHVIKDIQIQSLCVGILGMVISIILAIMFTRTIVEPIQKLKKLMRTAQEGDLTVYFKTKYNDEIGELGNSFNTMVKEIDNLMNLVQIEEKKKRIAEMNVLQAQIKPHFMYNTLDTIRWMAEDNDEKEIVEIIEAFTNLLRISLSKGKEIITVREEMNHILSYLTIQKIRYEDKLDYEVNFEEEILDYKVIKLILQPLVENAIYHGIKEKRGNGKIVVQGKIKDGCLVFLVEDDGKGIESELLEKINNNLINHKIEDNKIGYGIFNVNERIKLRYGDEYGLEYKSIYGEATIVEVKHPIIE
ncbi:MAG: sensor histidine kinase [Clostridium sp.]|uniref:sensor histidine kinase n=1 Tax=Clostridium TaxID=1485 RepID=UPI00290022A9|nr:sensor histidine kinase [Clostridium sp.]MDU2894895.1 sensor histidine kinase [Clostridium sp.]MDU3007174.1 sensor histidine kinase [Clostridium sp.]MDU3037062.1 sensor histidine kinase [Clostridium sp.]MDU3051784.1 sensor histidine kinase [Clostridium sp.]